MKKRIFSRVLAFVMALSLLTTTVFAASLDDLQEAIDGTNDVEVTDDTTPVEDATPADEMPAPSESEDPAEPTVPTEPAEPVDETHVNGALVRQEDGIDYFGYGWSSVLDEATQQTTWTYAIEAHDEDGNRFVVLLDDVDSSGEATGVVIGQDGVKSDVTIDMKGHDITGSGEGAVITVNKDATLNLNNGTVSGGEIGIDVFGELFLDSVTVTQNGTGININDKGKVTFNGSNTFTDNKADVELKVGGKTYRVDADTAKAMLTEPVATGDEWLLFGKDGAYTIAYTGTGDANNQLTQLKVRDVLAKAADAAKREITGFAIPDGVKSIGNGAFNGQNTLKTISIPDSVTTISYSFQNCSGLEKITIPENVISCHTLAFSGCTSLKEIRILGSIEIGTNMFYNFTNLETVEISSKVTGIAYGAFQSCSKLKTVKWPEKAAFTEIGNRAFMDCSSLGSEEETFSIPEGVTSIGPSAFLRCGSIKNVILPDGVITIDGSAFQGCEALKTINIPDSVTTIAGSAFHTCSSLETIAIPEKVTTINNFVFANCTNLKTITIPTSVTSIGTGAFHSCKGLTSIELPNSLTTIGMKAFSNCTNLESIIIPTSVTEIGYRLFGFVGGTPVAPGAPEEICGVKSIWICPNDTNSGEETLEALAKQQNSVKDINIFVVNDNATLYRDGNVVTFNGVGGKENIVTGKNSDELVIVDIPASDLAIANGDMTTTVNLFDGATVTVNEDGSLIIPCRCSINGQNYYNAVIAPDGTVTGELIPETPVDVLVDFNTLTVADATGDTTITDNEIPLAGLISRAQLVSFLYTHEGSPDGEDVEGEYTLAMAWAVAKEIVDEEDDPDEIVTVAILREVMTNYAAYLDTTFDMVIEGEDDMIVMNCDEILAEFYASLEDKAA